MEHGDDTVQDGQQTSQRVDTVFPSEEQTAERESVVATNATPSCSARSPVAVRESSQSEGILGHRGEQTVQTLFGYFPVRHRDAIALDATPEAARPSPYHTNTHAQNGHTQPEGLRRVTDGASNSAMATAHRYEHSTAICGYSDYENLLRLQKALKGAALEAVSSLLLLPSGLKEAIDVLKLRFGRPEVIVENLMEKVRRMPAPRADRLDTLVEFGFAVRNLCATIQASGLPEYTCNVILLKELIVKLPSATCIEWARHQQQLPSVTLSDFGRWIGELAAALSRVVPVKSERFERSGSGDSDRRSSVKPVRPDQRQPTTARLNMHAATTSGKYPHTNVSKCSACQGECAALDTCQRFQTMTVAERKEHIRDKKLCRKCLKYHKGWCHLKTVCGSNGCEAMHHRLLHGSLGMTNTTEKHCLTHSGSNDRTLFRYVPVTMYGKDGRTVRTYAFLDEGSSSTFIDHSLMDELGLIGTSRPLCLKWTGDTTREEKASVQLAVQISGAYEGAPVHELTKVHTVSNLALPAQTIDGKQLQSAYPHLKGLPFTSYVDAVPRILIGVDNCRLGKPLKCTEGRVNEPIASKTRLGWMIYGPCPIATASVTGGHRSFHICSCEGNVDGVLTSEVKAFFSLDSLGISKPSRLLKSKDDERALVILNRETKLQGDRFETGLLWRYDDVRLPCNKAATMKRYELLKRKLSKDPELAAAVNQKMREYIQKGYIRRLSASEAEDKRPNDWFLPIFPVTNPNKPGKIRMIFDAAAKFREFRVAVVGDIREMFHQVMMRTEDQRSQMNLWDGDDPNGDPAAYVVTVMTFGAACSPSSAQFVKNRNAKRFEEEFPRAAKCIKDEHYVDDMLVSVETEEEAVGLAAVIGVRLAATIVNSHRLNISRTVFWTDSRNVLSWLRSDHHRYNQFVAFRVGELLETTEVEQWRTIPTKLNVPDDGTKWTKTPDLSPTSRWFNGPSFLWGSESLRPGSETTSPDTPEELRPTTKNYVVAAGTKSVRIRR
ncbi:uncharacterized protein LOC128306748 [Anopheles moucheti]|uniref:uncharacterized protein LOC128306748 n=1 Tax=Anopheles moucheti TaxID=186751 RepID=UPI0022F0982B|nr:uncharacterized protein LOC128306748 [Anopheles moucheti]